MLVPIIKNLEGESKEAIKSDLAKELGVEGETKAEVEELIGEVAEAAGVDPAVAI